METFALEQSRHLIRYLLSLLTITSSVTGFTTESPQDGRRGPIFLAEPPPTKVIPNNKGGLIPCSVYGNPYPTVHWVYGDGRKVETQNGIIEVLPNNSLYFPPFENDGVTSQVHTQTYRCVAENVIGQIISRSMRTTAVIVEQLRRFNVQLNDVWVMRGGTAVFSCEVNPQYARDYVRVAGWTRDSEEVQAGGRISITSDGELHLRQVRDQDKDFKYQCKAKNDITAEVKSSPAANLLVHDPPAGWRSPTVDNSHQEISVTVETRIELSCVADGYPLPNYRWYKNGNEVDPTDKRYLQLGGNLVILATSASDSGYYKCNATNNRGFAVAVRRLMVTSPMSSTITPATQIVDSGDTATFNCTVQGHPIKVVEWFKDGKLLADDDRIIYHSETLLHIDNVQRKDQGMYQCFISNGEEEVQGTSQLLLGAAHPSLVDGFIDQFVQTGQKAALRCIAAGNPTPVVNWTLDGQSLKEKPHVSFGDFTDQSGDVISYVNISSVRLEDGGEYRCIVSNDVGEVEHVARLNVYGIPFIREMRNVTGTANEPLSIRCYVTGYPIERITWWKEGLQLPINHLQQVVNGTLTILKVRKTYDAGKYTCSVENSAGQGMDRSVFVNVLEPPIIDPFSIPAKKQGDRVTLSCVVSSGDLPIHINWTKDGKDIPHDIGIIVETSGSYNSLLKIGDVSPVHDGNYTCHAHNLAATVSYTVELHVDVPPRWVIEPENAEIVRLNPVFLDCMAAGTPDPHITWSKANGPLPVRYVPLDSAGTDHYSINENGTLTIMDITEEDSGYYLCRADNGIGHGLSKIIFLKVLVPARFDAPQANHTVLKNHNITMDCQAIGDKPLSVSWRFNNMTVGNGVASPRHVITVHSTSRGMLSSLAIRTAQRGDTGVYSCYAKNKHGFADMSMWLTVLEPPEAPVNLTIVEKKSRSVLLSWAKPFDGHSTLVSYIIEYQNITGDLRGPIKNITVTGQALTAILDGLRPSFLYNIRIRANNSIGLGSPSHQVAAKLLEEAPSGPPLDVEVKAIGSQKLQVTWKSPAMEYRNGVILRYFVSFKETKENTQFQVMTKDVDPTDVYEDDDIIAILITNLNKFTQYTVNVKASNKEGMGPASLDIQVFTLEDVPSQPPEAVQATELSSQSIKVVWAPPPLFTLHGILQGYKVIFKPVRKDEDETDANIVMSTNLEIIIDNLEKFTNYSIQVLAFTRKGEGVRSSPLYVRTMEDAPGRPAGIKALPINNSSITVSWQPPLDPNGIIISYNLYYSNTSAAAQETRLEISPNKTSFVLGDLESRVEYWVRVSASTRMGEGESTQIITVMPVNKAPAKIISFSRELVVSWQQNVLLPCRAVGDPEPEISWITRHNLIVNSDRRKVLMNGSLYLEAVIGTDAANYSCKAENDYGSDVITYSLSVQVAAIPNTPPKPPVLSIAAVTSSTIQVNWLSGSNGGSPILRFALFHRKEHDIWQEETLGRTNRTYTAAGLFCGTSYKFTIRAVNDVGRSESSNVVEAKTNGSAPIAPAQSVILKSVNVTSVELDLRTWQINECAIKFYSIKFQRWKDKQWVQVTNSITWNTTFFTVEDLHPATWYLMKITAHSDAGSTECDLKFATLTYSGSTLQPLSVVHKNEVYFYEKLYIIIPLCGAIVVILVLVVGLALYCSRRRQLIRYKENSSNIRRDITAETSLMNDLDKRINYELDSPRDARFNPQNVNLISLNSDENIQSNNQSWCFNSGSKTNSDNASLERYDDDANINPYATFNELKLVFSENPTYHKADPDSEEDSVSLEKAEAQKAMMVSMDSTDDPKYVSTGTNPPDSDADQHSYDNQAVVLSPRKYASADQIHALFTMAPPRPQSAYSKNRSDGSHRTRSTPSDKGSQRHSLISSVTTVSSSRDELLEAFENFNRNPPPPIVYETEADSLSQPTDSSTGTEPGICLFTQSPPQPDEQREASCEVPRYDKDGKYPRDGRHIHRQVSHTDISDHRTVPKRHRTYGTKHKDTVSRGTSMHSSRHESKPKQTEEVTYVFSVDDSPGHARKPQSFEQKLQSTRDGREKSVWRRASGRRTPHARTKYDTYIQTPGSADDKPLVSAQVMSARDITPDEEESVRLLDRYYRPLDNRAATSGDDVLMLDDDDQGYTENYTIV